jgi:hypothetical protein
MMHPPTYIEGPLRHHELSELAELMDDLDAFVVTAEHLPEDLRIRIRWWALRIENARARR